MDLVDVFFHGGDPIALLRFAEFEQSISALETTKESLTWENQRLQTES